MYCRARKYLFAPLVAGALAATLAAPTPANANLANAERCAAPLPPLAHRIYEVVKPGLKPADDLSNAIRAQVVPWVIMGTVTREDLKKAATQAAPCLVKLQH